MKKFLKIIGILILLLAAVVLIGGLVVPKKFHFEKSIAINAGQEAVWPKINNLAALASWMPWMKMDPNMKTTITGTDGTPGAKYSWEGNKDVGKGSMTINSLTPPKQTVIDLHFLEPMESKAVTTIATVPEGNATKVTWSMDGESPYPFNFIGKVFFDMEGMLDKDFGKGLNNLKALCEQ